MKIDKSKLKKIVVCVATAIGTAFVGLTLLAKIKRKSSTYETEQKEKNPMEGKQVVFVQNDDDKENADGVRGHLEAVGASQRKQGIYDTYVKRMIDIVLSFGGLIVLSPVFAITALAIVIEDPGPVLFSQKRIGKNKQFFKLHKFRSMKVCTPRDVPTHMLENPEQYITKVGKFIRAHSLDELPQIWDIFVGNMSVIGPRPALWNQDVLVAERDKYGANDVKPGLTGWAQINGRDELEIPVKAKLDGEYVEKESFLFDMKCFFGTVGKVAKDDSVVEGGTGEMKCQERREENADFSQELGNENKVSVIVATYHRKDDLKRALYSLSNQTYKNIEVVIIDDNDDLEWNQLVKKIIEEFRVECVSIDVRYIENHPNQGSARSRNIGIDICKGDYITFLDDDDLYEEKKVENQLRDMLKSNADYSITDLYLYNEKNNLIDKRIRSYIKSSKKEDLMKYHLLYHMTGTDTLMFKAEYLRGIGGFSTIDVGDEFYLMEKAILAGGKIAYSPCCYVKAYIHSGEEGGLSSGRSKIEGENALYENKKANFNYLNKREIKYVKARHYAVIAFAEMRMNKYGLFVKSALKAFVVSPIDCIKILVNR